MSFPKYKPSCLATLPTTLNPANYDISPETRRAQAEHLAIRSWLKQVYLLQFNNPKCRTLIKDPALAHWTYAPISIPNFRPTPKTSSNSGSIVMCLVGIGPLFFWYYVFKTNRDKKEKLIQEGKLDRTFNLSY
ncbi:PREDICTED: NADH dehydrogenase [ubiquinone] 1 beta subcomplex subunit 4-like [Chrysochloris asiatica]|uniref:NADH dehydrogenase [ubiquinone] 1 beta subcomplex subunit 4 n=1 Tax=Chrysochloris asiatica TaxID=185453 RepID=A0A9B0T238_CHRAS|nr:PREDICTED: NADH dehydrogenase [ubiquinone] 1 beta subcomplex subunit 4-like [Chrysochloris asiatica]